MDEYEGMRKFGREVDKIAGKMREMRASSEVEKMKCGPDGRQSASRERGMTGIERLRGVAGFWRENKLDDIVEQIEREQGGRVSRMRVLSVVTEMERHVSGVEGMEDSPVARWARELRDALGALHAPGFQESRKVASSLTSHSDASDVSMSAYDLLPTDERESIAWVRDHGGLDAVDAIWDNDVPLAEAVISELWPDGRPDECGNDDVMGELRRRLMPEGCEWPRYESGELVRIGDKFECWCGETHVVSSVTIREGRSVLNESQPHSFVVGDGSFTTHGQCVKRPSVPAADGEPLEVGQTVWEVDGTGHPFKVVSIRPSTGRAMEPTVVTCDAGDGTSEHILPSQLTHQRPVLDADGVPVKVGDHGWWVEQPGVEIVVKHIDPDECDQLTVCDVHGRGNTIGADEFTHTKPEPSDSWESIEEDARGLDSGVDRELFTHTHEDIVSRCRALAERERGE